MKHDPVDADKQNKQNKNFKDDVKMELLWVMASAYPSIPFVQLILSIANLARPQMSDWPHDKGEDESSNDYPEADLFIHSL